MVVVAVDREGGVVTGGVVSPSNIGNRMIEGENEDGATMASSVSYVDAQTIIKAIEICIPTTSVACHTLI